MPKDTAALKVLQGLAAATGLAAEPLGYYSAVGDLPEDAHPHVKRVRHIIPAALDLPLGVPTSIISAMAVKNPILAAAAIPMNISSFMLGRKVGKGAGREQRRAAALIKKNKGQLLKPEDLKRIALERKKKRTLTAEDAGDLYWGNRKEMKEVWGDDWNKRGKKMTKEGMSAINASVASSFTDTDEEKTATIASKLKTLITGRSPLYHGTSPERAKQIVEEGLRPDLTGGITEVVGEHLQDLNKGLTFFERTGARGAGKASAMNYAGQQRALDEGGQMAKGVAEKLDWIANKLPGGAGKPLREVAGTAREAADDPAMLRQLAGIYRMAPGTKKGLVRADVPVWKREVVENPEIAGIKEKMEDLLLPLAGKAREALGPRIGPKAEPVVEGMLKGLAGKSAKQPFAKNVVLKGGIDPKYMGKRPAGELVD